MPIRFLLCTLLTVACCLATAEGADFPPRPAPQQLDGGAQFHALKLSGTHPGQTMNMWVYLPGKQHAAKSLPCVFIAPAGSNLMMGMALADGDRDEHLPYVKAGFAVVSYDLDGPHAGDAEEQLAKSIRKYMSSRGGILNARNAIDCTLARFPEIDPERLYTAGHSSAGTVALNLAAADERIKACCAYAPVTDVRTFIGSNAVAQIDKAVAGFSNFVAESSPSRQVKRLVDKPVLLFIAEDDDRALTDNVRKFADDLKNAAAKNMKLVTVPNGGHYDSMIEKGIPAGIEMLKSVDRPKK